MPYLVKRWRFVPSLMKDKESIRVDWNLFSADVEEEYSVTEKTMVFGVAERRREVGSCGARSGPQAHLGFAGRAQRHPFHVAGHRFGGDQFQSGQYTSDGRQ